jgi:hypothetical protein
MARVLLAVSPDWQGRLGESVLWRGGVERFLAHDGQAVLEMARALKPRLIVLDDADLTAPGLVRRLREDPQTRPVSIAVLAHAPGGSREAELTSAGANAVLTDVDPIGTWDDRLEELLGVPQRREVRVPVKLTIWSRRETQPGADVVGVSLNVSVTGLLVETSTPLVVGTTLNLSFRLPTTPDELRLMGRVVWTSPGPGPASRSGIEFLGFHGRTMEAILSFSAGPREES